MNQAAAGLDSTGGKKKAPFPASHYVLSQEMMGKLNYPLAVKGAPREGFLSTQGKSKDVLDNFSSLLHADPPVHQFSATNWDRSGDGQ